MSLPKLESSRNVTSKVISNRIKAIDQNPQNNMIASFSFASTAHVTPQWSNYLTQRAEILSPRLNLTPQRAKKTVNESKLKQVGFTVSSLFFPRLASCSRQFTPNRSNFA